jgi:pimeloyl-ACP methyl ester carboxylesterase
MPTFRSYDGTLLAYHVAGTGPVLVCLPGGPGSASDYLGDLGGLSHGCTVLRLDPRGTGASDVPADPTSYRVDRLVLDVEALRVHLGLERFNLLGHSAGSNVAVLYAAMYPDRLERLVLLTGMPRIARLQPLGMEEAHLARSGEPWFAGAVAAGEAYDALPDDATAEETAALIVAASPFSYGRWDEAAMAHAAAGPGMTSEAAQAGFYEGYEPDPARLGTELQAVDAPVLVVAGSLDPVPTPEAAAQVVNLFRHARLVTIAGGGHFPWIDNPAAVVAALTTFLAT